MKIASTKEPIFPSLPVSRKLKGSKRKGGPTKVPSSTKLVKGGHRNKKTYNFFIEQFIACWGLNLKNEEQHISFEVLGAEEWLLRALYLGNEAV